MSIEEGAIIGGKLRLVRPLAKGGMGAVWIARHQTLDTDVAVKFMEGSIAENESARQRFEREAKAAALIKSPHVVQVLDYGIEGTTPYIVMELMEGEDLGGRLERVQTLDLEEAYRILEPVGKALRRAHDLGIVHRDLKPGNIFISRSGDEEIVKILDFGIAKDVTITGAATSTSSGMMLGSPSYMSPEQIRETKQVDHRSDLWSMGIILYEALTGVMPFDESENIGKLLVDICTAPFPPPSSIVPSLDVEVDRFFEKALARDKAARFQNMGELVEAFGALAGIRPAMRSSLTNAIGPQSGRASNPHPQNTVGTDATLALKDEDLLAAVAKSGAKVGSPPRASDPRSTLSPAESGSVAGSPRKRLVPVVLAVVAAVGILGAVVAFRGRSSAETPLSVDTKVGAAAGAPSPTQPAVSPGEPLRTARIAIDPPDAIVEVNGRNVAVDRDGYVTISGALGSTHVLRIHKDRRETRDEVAITATGALPDKLTLAAAPETKPAVVSAGSKGQTEPVRTAPVVNTQPGTRPSKDPKQTGSTTPTEPQPVRDFQ